MSDDLVASSNRAPDTKLLEIRNLSVDYYAASGTVHALDDINISLERGQILGLAGESGSGKSTMAYAITRLLRPPAEIISGQVLYYPRTNAGEDIRFQHLSRIQRKKKGGGDAGLNGGEAAPVDILEFAPGELRAFRWSELSIVFQSAMNALNPVLNIGAQIMDVLKTHSPSMGPDSRKQRAIELLRLVGISPDRLRASSVSQWAIGRTLISPAIPISPAPAAPSPASLRKVRRGTPSSLIGVTTGSPSWWG